MLEVVPDLPGLASEWDDLADRMDAAPFLRPGWFEAWWAAFGTGELELVALRRGEQLVAVLPLTRWRGGFRSPTNDHTPRFGPLVKDREAASDLARALLARKPRALRMEYIDSSSTGVSELRDQARKANYRLLEREWERPPYVAIDGTWEEYQRALEGKIRRDLARRRRRLADEGRVELDIRNGVDHLPELLNEGWALEPSGWKSREGTAVRSRPETQAFYTALADWAARRGILRLSFLRVGSRSVAFQYGLEDAGVYYFLKGGYDQGFRSFAPGKLLVQALLERAFEENLTRFEFLGADDRFKLDWTSTRHNLTLFEAFAPSAAGLLGWATEAYGRPTAKKAAAGARSLARRRSAAAPGRES